MTLSRAAGLHQAVLETWWGSVSCHNCQLSKPEDCWLYTVAPLPLYHPLIVPPVFPIPMPSLPNPDCSHDTVTQIPGDGQQVAWASQAVAISLAISKSLAYLTSIAAALDVMHCRCMQTTVLPVHSPCCRQAAGDDKAHVLGALRQHPILQCSFCSTTT